MTDNKNVSEVDHDATTDSNAGPDAVQGTVSDQDDNTKENQEKNAPDRNVETHETPLDPGESK